jgi:cephalosporin hydroxylase
MHFNEEDMITSEFKKNREKTIEAMGQDAPLKHASIEFLNRSCNYSYSYNFDWCGLPIIQYPQDIIAIQEIIWKIKPDLIIETGIARGGSLIFHASMLQLLGNNGKVIGIDIDIRSHNREAIENHPLNKNIQLLEGSSIDPNIVDQVKSFIKPDTHVLVILDSNHTHEHVLQELNLYSSLVTRNSYLIVLDTVVEDLEEKHFTHRPWGPGDNPKTAVHEFLKTSTRFEIDKLIHDKLLISVAPDGYLKCLK